MLFVRAEGFRTIQVTWCWSLWSKYLKYYSRKKSLHIVLPDSSSIYYQCTDSGSLKSQTVIRSVPNTRKCIHRYGFKIDGLNFDESRKTPMNTPLNMHRWSEMIIDDKESRIAITKRIMLYIRGVQHTASGSHPAREAILSEWRMLIFNKEIWWWNIFTSIIPKDSKRRTLFIVRSWATL